MEGKLNTGNILSAESLEKIESVLMTIEAKAEASRDLESSSPVTDPTMDAFINNFAAIDAIVDAESNEYIKEHIGAQLYGALRRAVSHSAAGKLNAVEMLSCSLTAHSCSRGAEEAAHCSLICSRAFFGLVYC